MLLSAEIIKQDVFRRHTQIVQHFLHGIVHEWRSAKVIIDLFGQLMHRKIIVENHLMDETFRPCPVIPGSWFRKCQGKCEIGKIFLNVPELLILKDLFP